MKIYNSNTFPEGLGMLDAEPNYNGTYQQGYDDGYKEIEDQVLEDYIVVEAVLNIPGFSRLVPLINNTNGLKKMLVDGKWVNPKNRYYASTSAGPVNVKYFYSKSDVEKYISFNEWFKTCIYLESIKIPEYYVDADNSWFMRYIPYRGFEGCRSLKTVVLPSNLIGINSYAFSDCISLENIELPAGLTHIGMQAFASTGIKKVIVPGGVKDIPENCFMFSTNLTSITLNEGVETIGNRAFYLGGQDRNIVTLNLPTILKKIGEYAFGDMIIENDITINPDILTQLSFSAVFFNGIVTTTAEFFSDKCYFFPYNGLEVFRNLVKVIGGTMDKKLIKRGYDSEGKRIWACPPILKIEENVTIAERGFAGSYHDYDGFPVSDVTISTNAIGDFAFVDNYDIQTVTISEGVEKTGNCMFLRAKNLKHVTLPITLKTVATATFNQANLDNIIIPKNVTAIEDLAFFDANINEIMMLPTTPPTLGGKVFESYSGSVIGGIYVPDEAVDAYKSAWSEWASLIKPMSER